MNELYAHQGGWDEVVMFGVPIIIAIAAVRWVERRNRKRDPDPEPGEATEDH